MVVVADLVDGRLKARGGGSGVIVGADGSILTNYHVIHDKDGRLHDVFVIGRFSDARQAPQLQCAGRPSRSKLQRELDLALIKCDMDLDGRAWTPASDAACGRRCPRRRASDIKIGQRLWVLGYPDVGGGGLHARRGRGRGLDRRGRRAGHATSSRPTRRSRTATRAARSSTISGRLVGIASAFRTRVTANGGVIETAQVGLVRPLRPRATCSRIAAAGWTPREGHTDVELDADRGRGRRRGHAHLHDRASTTRTRRRCATRS